MSSPLLLLIETSSPVCSVALSRHGKVAAIREVSANANHAALLPVMIDELLKEIKAEVKDIEAVGISAGPGSYTGLRIGAATAKGLCYALEKPLIAVDSLQALAMGMSQYYGDAPTIYCPTIDARRDEIYYGLFGKNGSIIKPSSNLITNSDFLSEQISGESIIIGGSGALKCQKLTGGRPFSYDFLTLSSARWMLALAEAKFKAGDFSNYVSFEPSYIKPAFISSEKSLLQ